MTLTRWHFLTVTLLCAQTCSLGGQELDAIDLDDEVSLFVPGLVQILGDSPAIVSSQAFFAPSPIPSPVRWDGFLESEEAGEYRLAARFVGKLRVELGGEVLLRDTSDKPKWITSPPLSLDYDHHAIRIELSPRSASSEAGLTMFWSGPRFPLEPIPERSLSHARDIQLQQSPRRGADLVRALRCDACHLIGRNPDAAPLRAPDLRTASDNLKAGWLYRYLDKQQDDDVTPGEDKISHIFRSLHGRFDPQQTSDLAAWLQTLVSQQVTDSETGAQADPEAGRQLFMTVGCLACHTHGDVGQRGPFGGGDLTQIGRKRPTSYFPRWLSDPASVNSNHRMPAFELTEQEIANLTAYFRRDEPPPDPLERGNIQRGRLLARSHRCEDCHATSSQDVSNRSRLSASSDWSNSCTKKSGGGQPHYEFKDETDRIAIEDYIRQFSEFAFADERLVAENNCFACHRRGASLGLIPVADAVVAANAELVDRLPTMKPPPLDSVGDKLRDRALERSIRRVDAPRRPWLSVRMPRFPLAQAELEGITGYFVSRDRVPKGTSSAERESHRDAALAERLVTAEGFGCTSCHAVGKVLPPGKTPLNQLGPSLSMPSRLLRKVWFDRWVRNPARITANMEMPSVQVPVPHVFDEDLGRQLDAVWEVLNVPGFSPPDPAPIRIARHSGDPTQAALVLTDVIRLNGRSLIKPFLIGLPNRSNVLLDLNHARFASWWVGDIARQRTQGKTWYWEAPMILAPESEPGPDLVLIRGQRMIVPSRIGQFMTEPDQWRRLDGGIELRHRLHYSLDDSTERRVLSIRQRFQAIHEGFSRTVRVTGLQQDEAVGLKSIFASEQSIAKHDLREDYVVSAVDEDGTATITLEYASGSAPMGEEAASPIPISLEKPLPVMPGFQVTQLPLRADIMPIALAWRPNGTMVFGSLKGRVWSAGDADADGMPDSVTCISDELAAPYGLHAADEYVDVLTKYGLIRLHDEDEDGLTDRHELVASGWGHTDDYHDWVVGLPKDQQGAYYVSVPCQQDDRMPAAAHLRGTVLRLVPRIPDRHNPQRFQLDVLTTGHRFPMGLARNRSGQLFVTDNQGNYNPFNELNHVVRGRHFGFINKLDRRPEFDPSLSYPAIDIPHPWTRSVNGICFLETPVDVASQRGFIFGPFEGHLVGCEYDTRRLIRMSLDRVNGVIQGAAYPMAEASIDPSSSLQGPINCGISPDGDLYIANLRDSGWGGSNNTGSIVRAVPDIENLPRGIAEVSAIVGGFRIRFTRPVPRALARSVESYNVESYRRISTPAYGGDDVDRRTEEVTNVNLAHDGLSVDLQLDALREGFVYEFRLHKLASDRETFYPAEAFYTLRQIKKNR